MATLMVLVFPTPGGALQMQSRLLSPDQQRGLSVQDAAIVAWQSAEMWPATEQPRGFSSQDALATAFWGILFGLIFSAPFFRQDVSIAAAALAVKFGDYGIDAKLINRVRARVTQGTSAIFILTGSAVVDKVVAAMDNQSCEIIAANLPPAKEDALRATFGVK